MKKKNKPTQKIQQGSIHFLTKKESELLNTPITQKAFIDLFVKDGKVYMSVPLDKYRITPR